MLLRAMLLLASIVTLLATSFMFSLGGGRAFQHLPPDISPHPDIFESDSLPTDKYGSIWTRRMATVGNGHVATAVYSDSIFVNGVYNGIRGDTRRARIPSRANHRVQVSSPAALEQRYLLDVAQGTYFARYRTQDYDVEHRVFAHRFFTRAIINQVLVSPRSTSPQPIVLQVESETGPESEDLDMGPVRSFRYGGRTQCGFTKLLEDKTYQSNYTNVCQIWTPEVFTLKLSEKNPFATFIVAIDQNMSNAAADWDALNLMIQRGEHQSIFDGHVEEWRRLWAEAKMEFAGGDGALRLAKASNAALYYLLSSLPSTNSNRPPQPFCGLAPSTLAYGQYLNDYNGHSFWDTATWMFPPVLVLHPRLAREALGYRMRRAGAARKLARDTGYRGLRFPWESAFTGVEVTNDCCPLVSTEEQHVTGDIAFAARQYVAATRDHLWLNNRPPGSQVTGLELLKGMAEFWVSRASFNKESHYYEINGVMPPDEDHYNVNNSAYTNVIAGYSIFFARYASCLCKQNDSIPESWMDVARHLKLPFDEKLGFHPEYDGYQPGTTIKQADVILLGYPIQYPMNATVRRNDLETYAAVSRLDGPAMTWAMHAIGMLDLGDDSKAAEFLEKSFKPHAQPPFQIWTEQASPLEGAVNFATGMGGFLQALLFGYAGLRLHAEELIINPHLPPDCTSFNVSGIHYLGSRLSLYIEESQVMLTVLSQNPSYSLQLNQNGNVTMLKEGELVVLQRSKMTISSTVLTDCSLPEEVIGYKKETGQAERGL